MSSLSLHRLSEEKKVLVRLGRKFSNVLSQYKSKLIYPAEGLEPYPRRSSLWQSKSGLQWTWWGPLKKYKMHTQETSRYIKCSQNNKRSCSCLYLIHGSAVLITPCKLKQTAQISNCLSLHNNTIECHHGC